jgi:hypothetical protein
MKVGQLLGSCWGFKDQNLESSYGVFRNHSCSSLDVSSFVVNFTMLLVSCSKNFEAGVEHSWGKTWVLAGYGALFFFPYLLMLLHRKCFLRHRELLLAAGRVMSALWLVLVALKVLHQPNAWMHAVAKTYSLQLQNAVILPGWQQLRLHYYLGVAVVHWVSDAGMLALGMPVKVAVVQSFVVQLTSLLVIMLMDAWGRARFLARYQGPCRAAALVMDSVKAGDMGQWKVGAESTSAKGCAVRSWKGNEGRGVACAVAAKQPSTRWGLKTE